MTKPILTVCIVFLLNCFSQAQEFGFGCFGLVGGFVGYEIQNYQPTGLDSFIVGYNRFNADSMKNGLAEFKTLRGFRVGLNIFRKNYNGVILTVKGFYANLSEKNSTNITHFNGRKSISSLEMRVNNYGIGVDLGLVITKSLYWKVLEGAVFLNRVKLNHDVNSADTIFTQKTFTNKNTAVAYSLGSGFILYLVGDYISLETSIDYIIWSVDAMTDSNGEALLHTFTKKPVRDIVSKGGLNFILQLNLGLPL